MTRSGSSEAERGRRLAEVWRASAPSNEEIERLRTRIAGRPMRRPRSRSKVLVVALVQGFMLGGATLAAAAWFSGRTLPLFGHRTVQAGAEVREAPSKRARAGGRSPHASVLDQKEPGSNIPHDAKGTESRQSAATGGGSVHAHAAHERDEARAPTMTPLQAEPESRARLEEVEPAVRVSPDGPWARVAQALSASDWQRADRALVDLAATADPSTRDAADLARAELWIAHGRGGAFRANVERLARSGFTPLIRKRAARLLERLP